MNVSMADAWNLGWKLAAVLRGTARPELLHTYSEERHAVAQELIDFDREFSKLFRSRSPSTRRSSSATSSLRAGSRPGVATRYSPTMITAAGAAQHLAPGFPVGMRFHSARVIRLADAKPMQLGHVARADGAWRLYVFADRSHSLQRFDSLDTLIRRFTPADAEPDAVIDVRAVFQQGHRDLSVEQMPAVLLPGRAHSG